MTNTKSKNRQIQVKIMIQIQKTLSCTTDRSDARRQAVSLPKRVVMGNNNHFCPGPVCRPPSKTSAGSSQWNTHLCCLFHIPLPFSFVRFASLRQRSGTRRVQDNQQKVIHNQHGLTAFDCLFGILAFF